MFNRKKKLFEQAYHWSPWTKVSLDNCPLDICPPRTNMSFTTVPCTNVVAPMYKILIEGIIDEYQLSS